MGGLVFVVAFVGASIVARDALIHRSRSARRALRGDRGDRRSPDDPRRWRTRVAGAHEISRDGAGRGDLPARGRRRGRRRFPATSLFHAGSIRSVVPHWLWLVLGILAVTGTIHAVNLTDGLDGLAAGAMIPPLVVLAVVSMTMHVLGEQPPPRPSEPARVRVSCSSIVIRRSCSWATPARSRSARCLRASRF